MAINTKRIVPITDIDWLTVCNMILNASGTTVTAIAADDDIGGFTGSTTNTICNEPVTTLDFTANVTVYFVAAHDFKGITNNGAAATLTGATIKADGCTLYSATNSSGTVTIAAVTPGEPA